MERLKSNRLLLKINDIKVKYDVYNDLIEFVYREQSENKSNIDGNLLLYSGKVRKLYKTNNEIDMVANNKLSAFDTLICEIPFKGRIINKISC